jgi:hypothetical protein
MSFHMDVRVDKVYEGGAYRAVLEDVEEKDTKYGERLMWTFRLLDKNGEVVGFTSMSPSTKAYAYQWAAAIMGEIDPKGGCGPEDVIGGECVVVLGVAEDANGQKKNKVAKVKPPKKDEVRPEDGAGPDDPGFGETPI